jgi:transcriptional regulator with XRE-family HTH domain
VLLRRVIGDALRARRQGQQRTLRDISTAANVSLGYLSEIERGQKEASSELLAAICEALGSRLSEVLREASDQMAHAERAARPLPAVPEPAMAEAARAGADARGAAALVPESETVTDGQVAVAVRRDGPLRTTLRAVRARRPGVARAN